MDDSSRLRILVLGYIVRRPLGGGTWPTLQWARGLRDLGHDVYFFEDSEDWPACYDPSRHVTTEDPSFGLRYAARVFDRCGLGDRWTYYDAHTSTWHGPIGADAVEIASRADLLINNSGIHPLRPWLEGVPNRAYIDTDPGFEQIRLLRESWRMERARGHTVFFTLGENIPSGRTGVPETPFAWQPMRQPVVLDMWPVTDGPSVGRYTTVMNWDAYEPQEWEGVPFEMKSASFEDYWDLPARMQRRDATCSFEIALGGAEAPRARLLDHAWTITNPLHVTRDPWIYQQYLRASKGEFTVAKAGYAKSACGWFSERSAHYLASGRPVVTQDTGFRSAFYGGGERGLLAFSNAEEAIEAVAAVQGDYAAHCRAAREVAAAYFDSRSLLPDFLARAVTR